MPTNLSAETQRYLEKQLDSAEYALNKFVDDLEPLVAGELIGVYALADVALLALTKAGDAFRDLVIAEMVPPVRAKKPPKKPKL